MNLHKKQLGRNFQQSSLLLSVILLTILQVIPKHNFAQDRLQFLTEGRLWETVNLAKMGPGYNNWNRSGYGMDFPGYDVEWIASHIGLGPSHTIGGGFWIGALDDSGRVLGREDFALYAGSVGYEQTSKYIAKYHRFRFNGNENYYMQSDPNAGEITIDTEYQWNPDYRFPYERKAYLPIKVHREVQQWVTHEDAQDYIIVDYTISNVGDSTMHKTYMMFLYGFSINARGWSILFPDYNQGARNNRILWDPRGNMMWAFASDFKDQPGNETYDYWDKGGPNREGEYLAPGYAGLKFLYISPDSTGQENHVNGYGWAASTAAQASHPFTNKGTLEEDYAVLRDPSLATDAVTSPGDDRWGTTRMWSMVSLGPWDLAPGDSVRIVTAELVGSVPYKTTVDPGASSQDIAKGRQRLFDLADQAQLNFDNNYNIPDPPAPPSKFNLEHLSEDKVGATITWSNENESIPDPDYSGDEALDLAGYRIYRSNYLPIGPWDEIGDVSKGDPDVYDQTTQTYTFVDTNMSVGEGYYYAITAYDTGHASWPVNPAAYPNGVPALESSRYINRTIQPFRGGFGPSKALDEVLVVPNPFVISSGLTVPGDEDLIQFVNLPSPCTIRIYTVRGDLVKTIEHTEDIGTASWDQVTDFGQFVEPGVYIFHITSHAQNSNGQTTYGKFSIIR